VIYPFGPSPLILPFPLDFDHGVVNELPISFFDLLKKNVLLFFVVPGEVRCGVNPNAPLICPTSLLVRPSI
jgi:hypothetical protein